MPVSPAKSLHLYLKEMKESTSGKIVFLQDSIANRVVFDALYYYCKTKMVLGLLCQLVSLWAHKSEISRAEKWLCKPCCNTATEIDGAKSERETYKPCLAVLNIEGLTMQREREDQSSINFTLLHHP